MGLRRVQGAFLEIPDENGIPRVFWKGEEVALSEAQERRLDALVVVLAPVGATAADVEARAAQSSAEDTAYRTGHGPQPAQRGPQEWQ
jgi:hypothetical protein